MAMSACPEQDSLVDYLRDLADPAEAEAIELHVERCASCQSALDALTRREDALSALRSRPVEPSRPGVPESTRVASGSHHRGDTTLPLAGNPPPPPEFPDVPGYELRRVLGFGGMGIVYEAVDLSLGRRVALKMLRTAAADPVALSRFRREAELVARLSHPSIVQVFAIGEADGRPYIALELVPGGSLADRLDGHPIESDVAAALIEPVARAIEHAHRQGVVHRDLKPGNLLLQAPEGTEVSDSASGPPWDIIAPKIADFGLARVADANQAITESGVLLGTPGYMAPEQARMQRELTPAVDIYALGAILYELLTGRPPFLGRSHLETAVRILADDPIAPRRLNPAVPRDLETICLKCLEKPPRRRYHTADLLADDLARFRRGEPIQARPLSFSGRLGRWARRNPSVASLLGLLLLLTGAGSIVFASLWLQARSAESVARQQTDFAIGRIAAVRAEAEAKGRALVALQHQRYAQAISLAAQSIDDGRVDVARAALDDCPSHLRRAEWHYLWRLAAHTRHRLHYPEGQLVAVHPESDRYATIEYPLASDLAERRMPGPGMQPMRGMVRVRSLSTGREEASWLVNARHIQHLMFADSGRRLVVVASNPWLVAWDLDTKKEVARVASHGELAQRVIAAPTSAKPLPPLLLAVSEKGTCRLIEVPSGKERLSFPLEGQTVGYHVAFDAESQWLAIAARNRNDHHTTLSFGRTDSGTPPARLNFRFREVTAMTFCRGDRGEAELAFLADRQLCFSDVAHQSIRVAVSLDSAAYTELAIDPTRRLVALVNGDRIAVWVGAGPMKGSHWANRARLVRQFRGSGHSALFFTESGKLVAAGAMLFGTVDVWDSPGVPHRDFAVGRSRQQSFDLRTLPQLDFRPGTAQVAVAAGESVEVWDTPHGARLFATSFEPAPPPGPGLPHPPRLEVLGVTYDRTGQRLAIVVGYPELLSGPLGREPARVEVRDARTFQNVATVTLTSPIVRDLAFGPGPDALSVVDGAGVLTVSHLPEGKSRRTWTVPANPSKPAPLPADRRELFVLTRDGRRLSWIVPGGVHGAVVTEVDTAEGALLRRYAIDAWNGPVSAARYLDDRRLVVSSNPWASAALQVWDTTESRPLRSLSGYSLNGSLAAMADGSRLVTGEELALRLWNPESGQELLELRGTGSQVRGVGINADGTIIAAYTSDGTLRVWTCDTTQK